jgi:transposase
MITLPPAVRVFIATEPTDIRKSFDGLAALVCHVIKQNPLSGHMFVFRNKAGYLIKILFWDRAGFCIWYKRLEEGVFRFPKSTETSVQMSASELALLLEGIDLSNVKRQKRFSLR